MTSLAELIDVIRDPSAGRSAKDAASSALTLELTKRARSKLGPAGFRIDVDDRTELVALVLVRLLHPLKPIAFRSREDQAVGAYLSQMLENAAKQLHHKRKREAVREDFDDLVAASDAREAENAVEVGSNEEWHRRVDETFDALEQAAERVAIARRRRGDGDLLRGAFREIREMFSTGGRVQLRDILERDYGLLSGESGPAYTKIRDARLQAHHRAREALAQGIDLLQNDGKFSLEEASRLRQLLSRLVKCQRPEEPNVLTGRSER